MIKYHLQISGEQILNRVDLLLNREDLDGHSRYRPNHRVHRIHWARKDGQIYLQEQRFFLR